MVNILAITDNVGSNYHRIQLPLKYFNKQDFNIKYKPLQESLKEEDFIGIDILFFNWTISNSIYELALYKKRFGFKIIMDMDDYWDVSRNHPSYIGIAQYLPKLKDTIILADKLLVTTEHLKNKISYLNQNVEIVPNRIPYGDDQFNITEVKKRNKIRIGFIGSISHLPDWISIQNDLNRVVNDSEIMNKCEFVICGYNDLNEYSKNIWIRLTETFKGKCKVFRTRDIDSYMHLYNEVDIALAPLVNTGQNLAKSELKIIEAACKGAIVLGSGLYEEKLIDKSVMLSDKDKSYYTWIKELVQKEDLHSFIEEKRSKVITDYTFNDIILKRENIFKNGL